MTLGDVAKNQVVKISALAHKAPFNGPIAYRIHNTKISIQRSIAEQIQVVAA